jgi:alkyl hydroperoxide reductase subunit AhpC
MIGQEISNMLADHEGSWVVLLLYPADVPAEREAFARYDEAFADEDAVVLSARIEGDRSRMCVIDPEGFVRSESSAARGGDRRPEEALHTIRTLRTGAFGAVDWRPGETLTLAA